MRALQHDRLLAVSEGSMLAVGEQPWTATPLPTLTYVSKHRRRTRRRSWSELWLRTRRCRTVARADDTA